MKYFVLSFLISIHCFGEEKYDADNRPHPIQQKVRIDPKLSQQLPLDLKFRDESGAQVRLGDYFGTTPVILSLVYYECPSLCGMVMTGIFKALRSLKLEAGTEYQLVLVSISPDELPAVALEKKKRFVKAFMSGTNSEGGIHYLTGDEPEIVELADSIGYRYHYDEQTAQYAHPATAVVVTPQGQISQYHEGVEFSTKELRLSLVTASQNKIGTWVDRFYLYCYRYDPSLGKYGIVIMNVLRLVGAGTAIGIGFLVLFLVMGDRHKRKLRLATT